MSSLQSSDLFFERSWNILTHLLFSPNDSTLCNKFIIQIVVRMFTQYGQRYFTVTKSNNTMPLSICVCRDYSYCRICRNVEILVLLTHSMFIFQFCVASMIHFVSMFISFCPSTKDTVHFLETILMMLLQSLQFPSIYMRIKDYEM